MQKAIEVFIHSINNKLTHIISSAQLLKKSVELDDKARERINYILESSINASKAVEELGVEFNLHNWRICDECEDIIECKNRKK